MNDGYLEARGIAYRASEILPERPTLVFVHGLSGSLSAWLPFEPLLSSRYNLVEYDLRGHGLSLRPGRSGYTMPAFVEDLEVLLASLGVARASLVSHSLGTLIAMEYIRAHPERILRTVYLAPAYGVSRFFWRKVLATLGAALALFPLRIRPYGRTDYARYTPTEDYSVGRIVADIMNMGLRPYFLALRVVFEKKYEADWLDAKVPALLVHGTEDSFVPIAYARELARKLPGSRLHEIEGANHILVMNNIPEVAECIGKFVAQ